MTDRELLELAAKAAEITGYRYSSSFGCMAHWNESDGGWFDAAGLWDPLTNDGDALRLAIACRLGISVVGGKYGVVECVSFKECHCFVSSREVAGDGDLEKATRRAIVRAAAEIGKGMA